VGLCLWWLAGIATWAGCERTPNQFVANRVFARNQKLAKSYDEFATAEVSQRLQDIEQVVTRFFGTPDMPTLPEVEGVDWTALAELPLQQLAAGSVNRANGQTTQGLYRYHCVTCHGITGDGQGPTAAGLNPYPRDYRRGLFKFKRTASTLPPTDEDLQAVIARGVPGTRMPSFSQLSDRERTALVQYVRYLSIRGLFERALISEVMMELDPDERLLSQELKQISPTLYADQEAWIDGIVQGVVEPWIANRNTVVSVPPPPADLGSRQSIARGREMFFTTLTNCGKCHGDTAMGDGQTDDYDEWAKEMEPTVPDALADYLALGALPPRKVQPRNLRDGIYRGGQRPEDLFLRIKNGITGTTMPAVAAQLSDDDIWHLVDFVRYLPNDLNREERVERRE
jgi:mono/diheme cytochrome c family protein